MRSAWRRRCPQGHSSITNRGTGYHCDSCGESYAGEPFDAKTTEFPVDEDCYETREHADAEAVLRAMAAAYPDREWTRASHLSHLGRPKDIGCRLRMLRERGLVEKNGMGNDSDIWRPTALGFDVAQSDGLDRDSDGQIVKGCQP